MRMKNVKTEQSDTHTVMLISLAHVLYLCADQSQAATAGAIMETDGVVQKHHKSFYVSN